MPRQRTSEAERARERRHDAGARGRARPGAGGRAASTMPIAATITIVPGRGARGRAVATSADDDQREHGSASRSAPRVTAVAAGSATPSRIAAIGGTRVARSAGSSPASTVTPMPASSDTTIVRDSSTVPLSGRSAPNALNSWSSAGASADPREQAEHGADHAEHQPFGDDRAHASAGARPPSVRSSPNSRVRCATVIEKVLKMMNAPTNSAT